MEAIFKMEFDVIMTVNNATIFKYKDKDYLVNQDSIEEVFFKKECRKQSHKKIRFGIIMSYENWTIIKYKKRYYAVNDKEIKEVILVHIEKSRSFEDYYDDLDFGCDYNGQSDDLYFYAGFNEIRKVKPKYFIYGNKILRK